MITMTKINKLAFERILASGAAMVCDKLFTLNVTSRLVRRVDRRCQSIRDVSVLALIIELES